MNVFYKFFCRTFQFFMHAALPFLPYREPKILNSIDDIVFVMKEKGLKSALLVTDKGLKNGGNTSYIENKLKSENIKVTVYDDTNANPTVHNVEDAREKYIKENCDCLIAFGGGSSIDCAKAVGARIAYPKKSLSQLKGLLKVRRKIPTLFAIPTTAGTGSEGTITAVITDSDNKYKYTMNNFTLIPRYAVLDPKATFSLPPHLTATTGMDALTHAVEAFIGRSTSRQTRRLSLEAVKLIYDNIEIAYNDGKNLKARQNMLTAAYKAGIAFSKSYVGYIHSAAHSLGGQYNIPHGFANAVLMPIVLDEYGSAAYKKLHKLGVAAGVCKQTESDKSGAEKFIRSIRELNEKLGIPSSIKGIEKDDIPVMAAHASKEANPLYPVPKLMNAKELEKIYIKVADWSK